MSAADLENERLTEQTSLAEYYFEIRGQDALQQILNETVDADKKAVESEQARYDTGVDDQISLVEAQTTLASAQSAAINLGIARAQYEHAIAMLVGKQASIVLHSGGTEDQRASADSDWLTLATAGTEAGRCRGRAEHGRCECADRGRVCSLLSGTDALRERRRGELGHQEFAGFIEPILVSRTIGFRNCLRWGLRRATVNQYIATYNADLAGYRQSVLNAFQQVEDALAEVRILSQQILRQQEAVNSSKTFLKLEQARYDTGIDPYIDVVTAQTTLLSNQQTLTNIQIQEMTASVLLIEALGGGWDRSQLPTPVQVTAKPTKAETTIEH